MIIKQDKTYSKAFTLIELLVVIFIISLLAALILVNMAQSRKKGRDAKRKADVATIQQGLEMYYAENHHYLGGNSGGVLVMHQNKNTDIASDSYEALAKYIVMPQDPLSKGTGDTEIGCSDSGTCDLQNYWFYGCFVGEHENRNVRHYIIFAKLENKEDPDFSTANHPLPGWIPDGDIRNNYDSGRFNYYVADFEGGDSATCTDGVK